MGLMKELGREYEMPPKENEMENKKNEIYNNISPIFSCGDEKLTYNDIRSIYDFYRSTYLHSLNKLKISPIQDNVSVNTLSWIKVDKIVYEKDIFFSDCLSMVYSSLYETAEILAIFIEKNKGGNISFYFGIKDKNGIQNNVSKYILQRSISGNLPGLSYKEESPNFDEGKRTYVSSVSGIASLKGDKKQKFMQGVERLINSTDDIPSYAILFLAQNIDSNNRDEVVSNLRNDYSFLSKYSEITKGKNESKGESSTKTETSGSNSSKTKNDSSTVNSSDSSNTSVCKTEGTSDNLNAVVAGAAQSNSTATTNGTSKTEGKTSTKGSSTTDGKSTSTSIAEAQNTNAGSTIQYKSENRLVKDLLSNLERLITRYDSSERFGLWDFAAYFMADTSTTSIGLASIYKGIITGTMDGSKSFAVNYWDKKQSLEIKKYIFNFTHPKFVFNGKVVSPAVPTTSEELAINMSLPQSSISGVLVREQVPFGRNIITNDEVSGDSIELGNISHLGKENVYNHVLLNENLLTSHVFVTGSTGSGKSNTIYYLVDQLKEKGKTFLIIEPAKGEYKNVFGGYEEVTVYSTNASIANLLKINPFSFPDGIHVAEHIDRLVDIFNACWPMYAAMPAVLKEAISRAYKSCGWDLKSSTCASGYYPSINDVISELNLYINSSEYSADSKGDYKGAIGTRLQSLANGIIGQIFEGDEISGEHLFNSNVIVDLSRVGSTETKSLIMGFIVMKLNEFRMSENCGMNLPLRHITVLEEAHNLLKQTSTSQSQESSNLAGKSVEMISSAIAEMRTYGECFIISDQSPTMLDKSAISNTNTKIIMSLPNKADRELAAYSVGLNEGQSIEISKLKTGLGVVYQKGWEEPVLCAIKRFTTYKPYLINPINAFNEMNNELLLSLLYNVFSKGKDTSPADFVSILDKTSLSGSEKFKIKRLVSDADEIDADICSKAFVYFLGEDIFLEASKKENLKDFNEHINTALWNLNSEIIKEQSQTFMNMYVKGCSLMNSTQFYNAWLMQTNK